MPTSRAVVIAALILISASIASTAVSIYRDNIVHAFTLATTHQPEQYSELFFAHSSHLPSFVPVLKPQRIVFHITNHEASPTTYTYVVTQDGVQLARGDVTLPDGQGMDVPFTFMNAQANHESQLSVHLIGRAQHIDFRCKS
jgi:hypothetical protein